MARVFTPAQKRREVEREIAYRIYVYAGMVTRGKMTKTESDYRIAIMEAIAADYRAMTEQDEMVLPFPS